MIIFTLTGSGGYGDFNGTPFLNETFTVTAIGDSATLAVRTFGSSASPSVQLTSMVYQIGANPAASAASPSDFYAALTDGIVSGSVAFADLGFDAANFFTAGASSWDLVSDFGPNASNFLGSGQFLTDQGLVALNGWTSATFSASASATPEPASFVLMGCGGLALAVFGRRIRGSRKG